MLDLRLHLLNSCVFSFDPLDPTKITAVLQMASGNEMVLATLDLDMAIDRLRHSSSGGSRQDFKWFPSGGRNFFENHALYDVN